VGHARDRIATPVAGEQYAGSLGEHPADFPTPPLHAGDLHGVVAGRLVTHPRDHGGFGPAFDRDAFRPGHGAAADGGGVCGDGLGQCLRKFRMTLVKRQERQHGGLEVLGILRLPGIAAFRFALAAARICVGGALGGEILPHLPDDRPRCPDAP
jgi:hypothetical protein